MSETLTYDCCVVGGGPAGVMAGLLFARAGCKTIVLEKHADFFRDFRGDTVHPSTLEVMNELGLLDGLLKRPHQRLTHLSGVFSGERVEIADFSSLNATCKFIAFMPQWEFLDYLSGAARSLPGFSLKMDAKVTGLIEDDGRVVGVHAETSEGALDIRAKLVIGADGRGSTVRACAGLKVKDIGAPIDVLWFRLPRAATEKPGEGNSEQQLLNVGAGRVVITIDRGDYDQCAFIIPKGGAERVMGQGIEAFRDAVTSAAPHLSVRVQAIRSFDDVRLLTVAIDRLEVWSRPGLLMIGDSAHAMSPIGGVGINLAIQDAVAAANLLAGPLADGTLSDEDLDKLRARRSWPVRATQFMQVSAQNRILSPILSHSGETVRVPLPLRVISNVPWLKRRVAAVIGIGVRPEHVKSPERHRITEQLVAAHQ